MREAWGFIASSVLKSAAAGKPHMQGVAGRGEYIRLAVRAQESRGGKTEGIANSRPPERLALGTHCLPFGSGSVGQGVLEPALKMWWTDWIQLLRSGTEMAIFLSKATMQEHRKGVLVMSLDKPFCLRFVIFLSKLEGILWPHGGTKRNSSGDSEIP